MPISPPCLQLLVVPLLKVWKPSWAETTVFYVTACILTHASGLQVMDSLLDRTHLIKGEKAPYKDAAVGYELVKTAGGQGLLSTVQ